MLPDLKKMFPEKYKEWQQKCFKRDNYMCQFIKENGKKCCYRSLIHPHHIVPKNESLALAFDVDNSITLCYKHHMYIHRNGLEKIYASKFREIIKNNNLKDKK